jgi:hypothetical protein
MSGKSIALLKGQRFEWCSMMSGKSKLNLVMWTVVEKFKKPYPQFFHECPMAGRFEMTNVSVSKNIPPIYPTGTYKITFHLYDDIDPQMIFVTMIVDVKNMIE